MSFNNLPGSNHTDLVGTDKVKALGEQVVPSGIELPDSTDPALTFPRVALPQVNLAQPTVVVPTLNLSKVQGSITGNPGVLDVIKEAQPAAGTKQDYTDPKVEVKKSQQKTSVSYPTQPQHISKEIAKVAPNVSQEVTSKFDNALLSVGTASVGIISSIAGLLSNKANTLNDPAAQMLSTGILNTIDELKDNTKSFTSNLLGSGLADAANQALALLPLRQIPEGIRSAFNSPIVSRLVSSLGVRAEWPSDGLAAGLEKVIENKLKITQDLFQAVGAQEITKDACDLLATGTKLLEQGIPLGALGMQVASMIKLGAVQQLNAKDEAVSNHSWSHTADLKRQEAASPAAPLASPKEVKEALKTTADNITGAFPGNMLYSAFKDGAAPSEGLIGKIPVAIAASMGSSFGSLISKFVNNPDPEHDSSAALLPSMYMSANPAMQKLQEVMVAFQKVVTDVTKLPLKQVQELKNNDTKLGGDFVFFVQRIIDEQANFSSIPKLAGNFITNKLSFSQKQFVTEMLTYWEQLKINPADFISTATQQQAYSNSIAISPDILNIVTSVIGPKSILDPNQPVASLIQAAVSGFTQMGGPVGPEIVYAAANQAILTRMGNLINSANVNEDNPALTARIKDLATEAAQNSKELSFPGAQAEWFEAISTSRDSSAAGLFKAGLPAAVKGIQETVKQQQTTAAVLAEMKAQNRGGTTLAAGEAANDINYVRENTDTQNFVSGALKHQYEAIKTVLLKTVSVISGTAKLVADNQLAGGLKQGFSGGADYFNFSKNIIKEITNALASTTLIKVSGIKFEQQTEGKVQQAKFIFNQAGSTLSNEAPVIRSSARLNIMQAEMMVNEAHASGFKSVWEHHAVDKAAGFATTDYYVNAKGELTQTANKAHYYGQSGTEIADKDHVTVDVGQGKAQIHATNTGINIQFGSASIVLGAGGIININPVSAPSPSNVQIKYTETQNFEAYADNEASVLPAKGNRNPIPCASPYNQLDNVLSDLDK